MSGNIGQNFYILGSFVYATYFNYVNSHPQIPVSSTVSGAIGNCA